MIGPVPVKVSEAHVHDPDIVNPKYWTFAIDKRELEGLGYVCPRCGNCHIIKHYIDPETGMVAWD